MNDGEHATMKRPLKYLFTLALPAAVLVGLSQWTPSLLRKSQPAIVYDTVPASKGVIRKVVSTSGPVRALVTVSIGSQLSGQIRELRADFNTEVKPGDVLAVLDDKTFVSRVAQARADLAAAKAQLSNTEAALAKAEAVQRQAERAIARQHTLAQKGIAATVTVDTAQRDAEVAKAEIAVARAQIESARANVAQREAQLQQAQIDLDRTEIRSPINGTVISRTIDVGQTVAASLQAPELFKIAQDLKRIRIEAQVNEADVGSVSEGNDVEFSVDAYPERKFSGRVTQVRLAATELQSIVTYTVIIEAQNDDRRLFPGMTANAQIETSKRDGVLRVSNDALRFKPRDRQADSPGGSDRQRGGRERMLEALKSELKLNDQQVATLQGELEKFFAEMRAAGGSQRSNGPQPPAGFGGAPQQSNPDGVAGNRGRMVQRVEAILSPLLSAEQRPLFDRWKRGRENTRSATVWVRADDKDIESRFVRLGIADDQFTEVIGGTLKDGEQVVIRARDAAAKK
jgi:HlyD family secretion protein